MMEKKAFVVFIIILGVSIVYIMILCLLSGPLGQQAHNAFCSGSVSSCVLIGESLMPLVVLLSGGTLLLITPMFSPSRFVDPLFKPPTQLS
jgi:hypothetical protein